MARLALVIHSLQYGGAERVLSQLATHWAGESHEVKLITLSDAATDSYPLPPSVKRVGLDLMRNSRSVGERLFNNWRRIRGLRSELREFKPDVIVSFTEKSNILALLSSGRLGAKTILNERTDPRRHAVGLVWDFLRRRYYSHAYLLVVQTESVARFCRETYRCRVKVIPNMAPEPTLDPKGVVKSSRKRLLAVGRLDPGKGFQSLIEVFSRLAVRFPEWDLRIVGEGPSRNQLEQTRERLRLSERVQLPGWSAEISAEYREADLFVLSSSYEGFPNALLEALAHGVPAVSFDCDSGPREIVRNEIDGLLVPAGNLAALEESLSRLMSDGNLRTKLGLAAPDVQSRFSAERFFSTWDEVLNGVLKDA